MTAIAAPAKILVSGANGYIAAWVVRTFLESGYSVRSTVRSAEKGKYLQQLFAAYGGRHELVVVEDITREGAFDEAVKGVDAIAHTASPFHMRADDPNELIEPAVRGTLGILQSALTFGVNVKRVVVTSSTAAIVEDHTLPRTFSEADWNEESIQIVEKEERNAKAFFKYRASKALAEKASWDFVAKHKDTLNWDLTVVNPPMVFGPPIHDVPPPSALGTSLANWYAKVLTPAPAGTPYTDSACWVDVRDIAEAHKRALEMREAGGERVIICAGAYRWQDWLNAAQSAPSDVRARLAHADDLPHGDPAQASTAETVFPVAYDARKSGRVLGMRYRSMQESAVDMVEDFAARGW